MCIASGRVGDVEYMKHTTTVFCGTLACLIAFSGVAHGQYSKPIQGLDGKPATVCRATSDGRMLVGTSRVGGEEWTKVTVWRAPDWQPEAAYTLIDTSMGWPMSAQLGWIQDVSDVGGVMIAGNPMADVFVWWDGPSKPPRVYNTEGQLYWANAVSENGAAVVGLAEDDAGALLACVYRPDGSIAFFEPLQSNSVAGVGCVSPNGTQFGGSSSQYPTGDGDWIVTPAVWIDGVPGALPAPVELFNVHVTSINDAGDHAVGQGTFVARRDRRARVEWTRNAQGEWRVAFDADFIDELWGQLRGDGRRQVGFTGEDERIVLRDVYHGDRGLNDVIHALFPELASDRYYVVTAAAGADELVVAGEDGAWSIRLPALADLNEDRRLDDADLSLFIAAFADGARGADWNMDGFVEFHDFDAFIADFALGT